MHKCGQMGKYASLCRKGRAENEAGARCWERDHVPSKAVLTRRAEKLFPRIGADVLECVAGRLEGRGRAVVVPARSHTDGSRSWGPNNTQDQIDEDAEDLQGTIDKDAKDMIAQLKADRPECVEAYKTAIEEIKKVDFDDEITKTVKSCKKKLGVIK